jgi:hypothetical protein
MLKNPMEMNPMSREGVARIAATALACAALITAASDGAAEPGFSSDVSTIQVVTTILGGKNVFIPSTIVVTGNSPHSLSLYNTTEAPHGFRIPGLGIEVILPPQEETTVELPALEGGQIHAINCHLHPAHRTATLVVMPGK